ncbi:hypothetical protein [Aureimonas psammosilenae]|nr:hypothetical protein [Aureimonas psammosilenae]
MGAARSRSAGDGGCGGAKVIAVTDSRNTLAAHCDIALVVQTLENTDV